MEKTIRDHRCAYTAIKNMACGKSSIMTPGIIKNAASFRVELARLKMWAEGSKDRIGKKVAEAKKAVGRKEQFVWWKGLEKKGHPIIEHISELHSEADLFLKQEQPNSCERSKNKNRAKTMRHSRTEQLLKKSGRMKQQQIASLFQRKVVVDKSRFHKHAQRMYTQYMYMYWRQ